MPLTTGRTVVPARAWAVLGVVLAADALDLLDSTITTVAAPTIAADLHGGEPLVQWLGASYALALGVLLVLGGRLGDLFGRRRMFLVGIVGFTLASTACGLADDPTSIIVARLVQGAFGALLIPQGFGILGAVFPRDQIGRAFSAFGPVLGLSAVGGPILAGFLIDADLFGLGWRPMFLINIVIGGVAAVLAARLLPKDTGDRSTRLDGVGSGLLAVTMLGLLYGLIDGSARGWTTAPLLAIAAGLAGFVAFCLRQRTAAHPLITPSLLRNRGFTSGLVLGIVFFAAVNGLFYVLSLFLQNGLGHSASEASLGMAPIAAGIVIASLAARRLVDRLGRTLIVIGLGITLLGTAGLFALVTLGATDPWALAGPVLVIGAGMGTCFSVVYTITIGDIDPSEAGSASGSLSAVQQLANALGAAAVTTVYFDVLAGGDERAATATSLVAVMAATLACLGLVRLLPRRGPAGHH